MLDMFVGVVVRARLVCSGLLEVGKLCVCAVQLRLQRFSLQIHCIKLYLRGISLYGDLKKLGLEQSRLLDERNLVVAERRDLLRQLGDSLLERNNLLLKLADREKPANKIKRVFNHAHPNRNAGLLH